MILDEVLNHQAFSNVLINRWLKDSDFSIKDDNLLVHLIYGVIQRKLTLDYYLSPYIKDRKIEDWVRVLLQLSIYQLEYMDRIPSHAVVNEAVTIAKIQGHQGLANFVNGVLRSYLRGGKPEIIDTGDRHQELSLKYSVDPIIINQLADSLEDHELEEMLASLLTPPYISVRINSKLTNRTDVINLLLSQGFEVEESHLSGQGLRILSGNILTSKAYKLGLVTVQDESSMLVAPLGQLSGGEQVLDACSAPGGKATHIASFLDTGHLLAMDISSTKLEKVKAHSLRLKVDDVMSFRSGDALEFIPEQGQMYDKIYIDAPCSGLGLMRRKPEIKYHNDPQVYYDLANLQLNLLNHLYQFLKPGGILVYSTCTLSRIENEDVVDNFLNNHSDLKIKPIQSDEVVMKTLITTQGYIRVWPHITMTDGFFIARFEKV